MTDGAAALLRRSTERRAGVEEILALLDAGRPEQADSLCDPLVGRKPLEADWDSIFATFARVADELHHQYALGFTPAKLDGKMHRLDVRVVPPALTARARKSYLATAPRS